MTTEQRLDRVENDLDAVRQVLASAATYAESANQRTEQQGERIDQLISFQDRSQTQADELREAQNRSQTQIDELREAQNRSQTQIDQLSGRVDEFVFHAQRLFARQATILERVDGRTESLEAIVTRLDRSYEEQKSQFQEFQRTTNAALERIDRVLDYLLRQQQG
jgi:chromosome segregation ATPase